MIEEVASPDKEIVTKGDEDEEDDVDDYLDKLENESD
jgi:hypothetical protein